MQQHQNKIEIIEKAKELIRTHGYSQNRAARELGVRQGTLNNWLRQGRPLEKPTVNRDWNQPQATGNSTKMELVNLGPCVNCGRPVMVAKFVAEKATWPIEHCSRECRNGAVDVEEMEAAI